MTSIWVVSVLVIAMTNHDHEVVFWFPVYVGSQRHLEISLSLKAMYRVDRTVEALLTQVSSHTGFSLLNEMPVEWY